MDAGSAPEAVTDLLDAVRPARRRGAVTRSGRPARPPRGSAPRRPALLLAALLTGGVAAAGLSLTGAPAASAEATSVLHAQQALRGEDENLEVKPQASVTVAEAQARLQEVAASRAASRAARAEAEAAAIEAARPKFVLPVAGARLTSGFGPRWGTFHHGIDLAAPMRTPEYAAGDGVVLRAGAASGFGLAVYILHENGDVTVYGHMDEILVEPGQYVDAGDTIALLGNRGQSTGPHLHFEVHRGGEDGERINPVTWLRERGVHL
ncbi:M23 family metallopeptidase [Blastococcus sp. PRF04-17]|uniref:M23 family metallopeptidase n=1 Tax=Blastococcus sp. PRF04-17 TaxID=2933797 RepID=UPI001FF0FD07|nr:M23 family metallopeptidase [Blastococcus sp. PRF04-17]UOY03635.1 M23 family metallopeptidase [Blastococcus sp. PRF04-17]